MVVRMLLDVIGMNWPLTALSGGGLGVLLCVLSATDAYSSLFCGHDLTPCPF